MSIFQWIVIIELGVLILVSSASWYDTYGRLDSILTHVANLYNLCSGREQDEARRRHERSNPRDPGGNPIL
jgi:hypothetical protein